jgi:hypothetical protein
MRGYHARRFLPKLSPRVGGAFFDESVGALSGHRGDTIIGCPLGDDHVALLSGSLAAAHAGSPSCYAFVSSLSRATRWVLFDCTFDAIFELAPVVRELLGHFVDSPRAHCDQVRRSFRDRKMLLERAGSKSKAKAKYRFVEGKNGFNCVS